jgi:hypothetical protein
MAIAVNTSDESVFSKFGLEDFTFVFDPSDRVSISVVFSGCALQPLNKNITAVPKMKRDT